MTTDVTNPPSAREGGLLGSVAFVTGGTRGIGRGVAEHLLRAGARVWITSDAADGDEVAGELAGTYGEGRVAHCPGDVASRESVATSVRRCVAHFGPLDIAVANAGIDAAAPFLRMTEQQWSEVLAVNLTGVFHTVQLAAQEMAGRGGRIVVVASTNAFFVEPDCAAYNASKSGLLGLVRSAALELASEAVTVNAVSPGLVVTRMSEAVLADPVDAARYLRAIPVGRFGQPADVAAAVGYLVSPEASWITGQQIIVDGGQTLGRTMS